MSEDSSRDHPRRILEALDFAEAFEAREEEHRSSTRALLVPLLEVMDAFDRVLAGGEEASAVSRSSCRLIAQRVRRILDQAGVAPTAVDGEVVDPERHEIVEIRETDAAEDDVIVEIIRQGYKWNGGMLRYAQVVVGGSKEAKG